MMALEAMDVDAVTFGPFLKEARLERGMTQEQAAQRLHVSSAAVSKWERGKSPAGYCQGGGAGRRIGSEQFWS